LIFLSYRLSFFFFQAEDGIRDFHVTGVQTCALPISLITEELPWLRNFVINGNFWEMLAYCAGTGGSRLIIGSAAGVAAMGMEKKIGRASCRERVKSSEEGG